MNNIKGLEKVILKERSILLNDIINTFPTAILSTTNPTCTGIGSNLGHRVERLTA
jgi:hypothetical protein